MDMSRRVRSESIVDVEALYREHRSSLVALARVVCGDGEAAEEAVQEVFVSIHRRRPDVADGAEAAYLRRAVLNQLRGGWRRRAVATRHLRAVAFDDVDQHTPERSALERERRTTIDAALVRLSARQRECAALRYFADLTEPAIATELGISVGAVKTHLHRARQVLSTELEHLR